MPYVMKQSKGKWCVQHRDTGESKECHEDKGMAVTQLRVLNQAYNKSEKK